MTRSYHEAAYVAAARRRQGRTGLVVILALVAVGVFAPDPASYALGAILAIVLGLIVGRAGR